MVVTSGQHTFSSGPQPPGGPVAADRNVISANSEFGIISDPQATGLVVQSNYIGTDITGSLARGNTYTGIYVGGSGALIGGPTSTPCRETDGVGNSRASMAPVIRTGTPTIWLASASNAER